MDGTSRAGRMPTEYGGRPRGGQEAVGSSGASRSRASRSGVFRFGARIPRPGLLLSLVLGLLSGCVPPDRPPHLPVDLPEAARLWLEPDRVQSLSLGPGLSYFRASASGEPWVVYLLRANLRRCDLGLQVLPALSPAEEGGGTTRRRISELLDGEEGGIVAAVNGDFFTPEGLPLGTEVTRGRARRIRERPALSWWPGSPPWMGLVEMLGDTAVALDRALSRTAPPDEAEVLGGFPLLLREGERVGDLQVSERPSFAAARHPRTAVGWDEDEGALWVVVVDGRQPEHSDGMTLPELTALLEALGVEEALNLDGGGSSAMVVRGVVVSSPSDAQGERPVANALGIRRDPAFCLR